MHNMVQRGDSEAYSDFDLRGHLSVVSQRDYNEATAWLARDDNVAQSGTRPKFAYLFTEPVGQK